MSLQEKVDIEATRHQPNEGALFVYVATSLNDDDESGELR